MRDFNNNGGLNVHGDFNLNDNSTSQHKLLINCTNEELLLERPFRLENIKIEQSEKVRKLIPFYIVALLLLAVAIISSAFFENSDLISMFSGLGSLLIGSMTLRNTFEHNEFQKEEMNTVKLINKILKQRRAE